MIQETIKFQCLWMILIKSSQSDVYRLDSPSSRSCLSLFNKNLISWGDDDFIASFIPCIQAKFFLIIHCNHYGCTNDYFSMICVCRLQNQFVPGKSDAYKPRKCLLQGCAHIFWQECHGQHRQVTQSCPFLEIDKTSATKYTNLYFQASVSWKKLWSSKTETLATSVSACV